MGSKRIHFSPVLIEAIRRADDGANVDRLPSEPRRHRCEGVVSEEKDKGERPRMGEGGSVCRAAALISSSCVALHVRIWRMLPHIRVLDDLGECVIAIHVRRW